KAVNFTAICCDEQVERMQRWRFRSDDIVSVFAGRIHDSGVSAVDTIRNCMMLPGGPRVLWASARSLWDVGMAERVGCDIITLQPSLIEKLDLLGEPLVDVARRTVKQFRDDRVAW